MMVEASRSFAGAFASGLLIPDRATPAGVTGPGGSRADKRYNVYRNTITVSLIDALASIFPATKRITGPEFFRAMARFHVRATPPASKLLFEYGRDFPHFIAAYEYAKDLAWLADVARIERAWLDAYHAADAAVLDGAQLSAVPPEELGNLVFAPHPATRIVASAYPALSIFAMNRRDGPVEPIESDEPEDALVTRPDDEVIVRALPEGGALFLRHLIAGATLSDAAAAAFEATPSFDLAANIAGMIEAGVFTTLKIGDKT
jgi:hypothetical protein